MPVLKGLTARLEKRDVLRGLGIQVSARVRPGVDNLIDEILDDAELQALIRPALAYEVYDIIDAREDDITLENGAVLHGAILSALFTSARQLVIAVDTIGPGIEEKSAEYFREGAQLQGLILDAMGSAAVENMSFAAQDIMIKEASRRGMSVSSPVSPGCAGWSVTEQFTLFKLVPAGAIGVRLTGTAMMAPRKSLSMAMGIGDTMPTWSATERCDICPRRTNCLYRHTAVHACTGTFDEPVLP